MKKVYDAVVTVNYYIPKFFDSDDVADLNERNLTKDYVLRYHLLDAPLDELTHRQTIEKVVFTERDEKAEDKPFSVWYGDPKLKINFNDYKH